MCDNCLNPPAAEVDYTLQAQKFLSCVKRTGESFGYSHVIDVLRGSESQKVLDRGHQRLSTYNIGGELSKKQWMMLGRRLALKGLIVQDLDSFGALKITAKGYAVMKGDDRFLGAPLAEDAPARKSAAAADHDTELFNLLRAKRKSIADAEGVPPYVVFSDKSLVDMAVHFPQSRESMLEVHGVGRSKLERYGDEFIRIIRDYCAARDIAKRSVRRRCAPSPPTSTGTGKWAAPTTRAGMEAAHEAIRSDPADGPDEPLPLLPGGRFPEGRGIRSSSFPCPAERAMPFDAPSTSWGPSA